MTFLFHRKVLDFVLSAIRFPVKQESLERKEIIEMEKDCKRQERRGSGFFWKILLILALGVFVFSAYQIYSIYSEYKKGVDEYQQISHDTVTKGGEWTSIDQRTDEDGLLLAAEEVNYDPPVVDFAKLQAINPDVVGWLEIEAIDSISYPIVQSGDNSYYLTHTVEQAENTSGAIFMDYHNSADFADCNTIIYGHNMKNGSMFGLLKRLLENEKYKDSKYLWICTPAASYRYEIFSLQYAQVEGETYTLFSAHDEQFGNYLVQMRQKSEVDLEPVNLNAQDRIVTLSTCTSDDAVRFVVQARWVGTYINE